MEFSVSNVLLVTLALAFISIRSSPVNLVTSLRLETLIVSLLTLVTT